MGFLCVVVKPTSPTIDSMEFTSYIDSLTKHDNHVDFEGNVRKVTYSYHFLIDDCIVCSFDISVEPRQLVETWTAWFEQGLASRDFRSIEYPALEHVARQPVWYCRHQLL